MGNIVSFHLSPFAENLGNRHLKYLKEDTWRQQLRSLCSKSSHANISAIVHVGKLNFDVVYSHAKLKLRAKFQLILIIQKKIPLWCGCPRGQEPVSPTLYGLAGLRRAFFN